MVDIGYFVFWLILVIMLGCCGNRVSTLVTHLTGHCYRPLRGRHERPRLKVHGAWAFGRFLNIFLMDDVARHDSSTVIEMISLTLEAVACQHQASLNTYVSYSKMTNQFSFELVNA